MKIQKLIELLKQYDPEREIYFYNTHCCEMVLEMRVREEILSTYDGKGDETHPLFGKSALMIEETGETVIDWPYWESDKVLDDKQANKT